ncbi:MAG: hypothetical protein HOE19_04540 [Candidatus Komeilibacteria bacterium]|jgi:hypothetical protein|nr:hypothetical protein [Candidatus Komeilibacteria bacterium]MBT4447941.1 hypothetical protein [Candidatus Komeilibacteria bacterium]
MLKKIFSNQAGLTFIELMMAIAIIVLISIISVVYIKGDIMDEVDMATDQLAADIRYTRNLATSNTIHHFSATTTADVRDLGDIYPPGGYGIYTNRTAGTYTIFADSGIDGTDAGTSAEGYDGDKDMVIKIVALDNNLLELGDLNYPSATKRYFTFKSENEVDTDMHEDAHGLYELEIDYFAGYDEQSYRGILRLGEEGEDGKVWVSLGKSTAGYTTPDPNPDDGGKEDPVHIQLPI